jgi:LPXTG-motif cell wall-anchored protein
MSDTTYILLISLGLFGLAIYLIKRRNKAIKELFKNK